MPKRILITGSAGYIGSQLVEKLKDLNPVLVDKKIGINVNSPEFLELLKETKPTIIYHLAAMTDIREGEKNPTQCIQDNVVSTINILNAKCKIIFTSSAGVYGENIIPTPEIANLNPSNLYSIGKIASEQIIQKSGLDYTILRLANVYGRGGNGVYEKLKSGGKIFGDWKNTRDYIHIDDILDALIKAQNWENGIYNISTGIETSVDKLADILGVKKEYLPEIQEQKRSCLDNSKALKMGWKPIIRLK